MLESCFNMAGMKVEFSGRYGAWQLISISQITAQMVEIYKEMFGEEALVQVVTCRFGVQVLSGRYIPIWTW